jgi:hypothetical protein
MIRIKTIDFPDGWGGGKMISASSSTLRGPSRSREREGAAMDLNEYLLECMVRTKLREAHEASSRRASIGARSLPVRRWLGETLVAVGERLLQVELQSGLPALRQGASHG